jgi:hypothetical protein
MRSVVAALLGLIVGAAPAGAQAWLTVADAEGRFRLEMPVPFDLAPSQVEPDGTVTSSYVYETADLALRFEVVDGVSDPDGDAAVLLSLVSRGWGSERMVQTWSRVVGRRTYRAVAIFPPELEGDAVIRRFMQSVRYYDGSN